jgi:hypothetical protein
MAKGPITSQLYKSVVTSVAAAEKKFHAEKGADKQFKGAWTAAKEAHPDQNAELLYDIVAAAGLTPGSNPETVEKKRKLVETKLLQSGAKGKQTHPWGESALSSEDAAKLTAAKEGAKAAEAIVAAVEVPEAETVDA